jgi:hypothetical protein
MWKDSMKACNCSLARITYDDFLLIMKGQTRDDVAAHMSKIESAPKLGTSSTLLQAVKEGESSEKTCTPSGLRPIAPLMPLTPTIPAIEAPLSMDDDDDIMVAPNYPMVPDFTPPATPQRGAGDYLSPRASPAYTTDDIMGLNCSNPDMSKLGVIPAIPKPGIYARQKSRSMDETQLNSAMNCFPSDARRAVALPETDPNSAIVKDPNISALQVNRQLYRAHREMRLAVLQACKRFDEEQAKRARDVLLAQEEENNKASKGTAGLVMRRVENKTVSSEAVRQLLEQNRKEQQDLMEKANKRGGRGKRLRKKTISDMSGMMGSLSGMEMEKIVAEANKAESPTRASAQAPIPTVIETEPIDDDGSDIRGATIPGEFRKVNDPFGAHGKYASLI